MLAGGSTGPGHPAGPVRPRARKDLALQEVGDDGLLYDREGGMVHILNRTALFAWKLCDGTRDPSAIASEMEDAFRGGASLEVGKDVLQILASFSERGLLED